MTAAKHGGRMTTNTTTKARGAARQAKLERKREAARRWRAKNPDYMPAYTKANRARITGNELKRRHRDPEYNARHLEAARAYRARNRERINANRSKSRLIGGLITPAEYDALLGKQKGACAICRGTPDQRPAPGHTRRRALCVDHCHNTNRVRGLLCQPCNTALGLFKDEPTLLKAALKYLRAPRHSATSTADQPPPHYKRDHYKPQENGNG
jgi:hypothetical protein